MDFSTLQGHVQDYVLDLPTETQALVPVWVNRAIEKAARRYNFRFMHTVMEATTAENTRKLADKPADWKETASLPWLLEQGGGSKEINWAASASDMIRLFGSAAPAEGSAIPIDAGTPAFLLETADELEVWPFPDTQATWDDGNYRLRVPYWAMPADLSADDDSNWLTEQAPFYVIYDAAAEGFLFNQDEQRAGIYQQLAEIEIVRIRNREKRSYLPDRITLGARKGVYGTAHRRRVEDGGLG